jgi:D-alanyl-D-alanine carboxypeptidase/D-alanyl-D-alanine-endopeptidase (penicillin-binding protein 4)
MHSRIFIYLAAGCVALISIAAVSPISNGASAEPTAPRAADQATWVRSLERVLTRNGLEGAKVSALVVTHPDGQVLFERKPDRLMIPASNAKLLTAVAALDAFGPTHQFVTEISSDAAPGPQGAVKQLYLRGGGDPAMTTEDWWRLASELRGTGLRAVLGDLVIDDSAFDRVRWHPSVEGVSSRAYHAPVGALNANYGSFSVTVRPGAKVGEPVAVSVNPPLPYLRLSNKGRTLNKKKRRSLVVDRTAGEHDEIISVRGGVRVGDPSKTFYRSVLRPEFYAGAVLKMQLEALGVKVSGNVRSGLAPESVYPLHEFKGRPVGEIVRLFMKFSNNGIAEAFVKNLGALASGGVGRWEEGVPEMRRRLIAHGIPGEGFKMVDGSGLSYRDRASPRALVTALRAGLDSFRWGPELVASLPIAARDGTLEKRASGAQDQVRAKTGLLNGVTGLSGYAALPGESAGMPRGRVVFSVLVNDYQHGDNSAMDALDQFAALLTEAPALH